jgi:hypothetical protein
MQDKTKQNKPRQHKDKTRQERPVLQKNGNTRQGKATQDKK